VWPVSIERLEEYVRKALREAKRNTNWVEPDEEWEEAVLAFCRGLYEAGELREAIDGFVARHTPRGERAAVGQLLLKLTTPGVPDIYQGDELWALSMVDPDNRRRVDFDARRGTLDQLASGEEIDRTSVKMHLIRRALALRSRRHEAFEGAYRPLAAGDSLCAFARGDGEAIAAVAVREGADAATLRLPTELQGDWVDVLAAPERGREVELGETATFSDLALPGWPVALLERARS
jgi:(1->4)-alpha-D-glucan 1-alpha-D-glucosylmutase